MHNMSIQNYSIVWYSDPRSEQKKFHKEVEIDVVEKLNVLKGNLSKWQESRG